MHSGHAPGVDKSGEQGNLTKSNVYGPLKTAVFRKWRKSPLNTVWWNGTTTETRELACIKDDGNIFPLPRKTSKKPAASSLQRDGGVCGTQTFRYSFGSRLGKGSFGEVGIGWAYGTLRMYEAQLERNASKFTCFMVGEDESRCGKSWYDQKLQIWTNGYEFKSKALKATGFGPSFLFPNRCVEDTFFVWSTKRTAFPTRFLLDVVVVRRGGQWP